MYIPYIDIDIKLVILTKKSRVVQDLKDHGRIGAVKLYMLRYKRGLKESLNYIRKVEGEMKSAEQLRSPR